VTDACSWCGEAVPAGEGYRVHEPAGARAARFCRLEHVVPWLIRGAAWEPGDAPAVDEPEACAFCGEELGGQRVLVVRERGELRIADGLCSTAHLLEWAKAGGRYAT
jgi:ribosomal protein L24E